ncbi:unnamed protein product [Clonostachys rhizophaga]|uniref:AB hydrolase-1 domain-containing protein n=1 Tax=Clonostachys rhizophaga TaxID=160324 RepID=A0A9N9V9B5_9HYPO|nr:unnamed protein product [Clonostachys rhizophaga]
MSFSDLKKTFQVSRGFSYTYYTSPARESKPTLALFHGWPDSARLWTSLINDYLVPNGYGIIAIDGLGFGDSSKPTDPSQYGWQHMTADVVEILDAEKLSTVISLGHDWGSAMCQRFYHFYPSRVSGLAMINAAYIPPSSAKFDLDLVNKLTEEAFGVGLYQYWHFFIADDAPEIMKKNIESVYAAAHGEPSTWANIWTSAGGMRAFIEGGRTQQTLSYATGDHKKDFLDRYGGDGPGFAASNCWYKATQSGVQAQAEAKLPAERKVVNVPAFFWAVEDDYVCRPALIQSSIAEGLLPKLKIVSRSGGHWALLERPAEFGEDILAWLKETFT